MKLRDLSELAARNLREEILRNSLTTLAVAVGVARDAPSAPGVSGPRPGTCFCTGRGEEPTRRRSGARGVPPAPATLVGQEITLRYAERRAVSSDEISKEQDIDKQLDEMMSGGISIISREKKLRIAGIIESDPSAGIGGLGCDLVLPPPPAPDAPHP